MSTARPIICSICLRALDSSMDEDGITYIHGAQHKNVDHKPDPIAAPDDWRGVCDFCSTDQAEWVLPAKTFTAPFIEHISAEDWAACDICAGLIEKDRWNTLRQRAVAHHSKLHPDESPETAAGVEASLNALYRMLRKNITGGLRHL